MYALEYGLVHCGSYGMSLYPVIFAHEAIASFFQDTHPRPKLPISLSADAYFYPYLATRNVSSKSGVISDSGYGLPSARKAEPPDTRW